MILYDGYKYGTVYCYNIFTSFDWLRSRKTFSNVSMKNRNAFVTNMRSPIKENNFGETTIKRGKIYANHISMIVL